MSQSAYVRHRLLPIILQHTACLCIVKLPSIFLLSMTWCPISLANGFDEIAALFFRCPSKWDEMEQIVLNQAALFIDFDGTLVDLQRTPDAVFMLPSTRAIIERLAVKLGGALAIVSGRDVSNLKEYVGTLPVRLAGAHGAQVSAPNGTVSNLLSDDQALTEARQLLAAFASRHGLLLEHKATGAALHFRQQPEREAEARAFADSVGANNPALRVIQGKMVSELTLADVHKGKAILALMSAPPFTGRIPIAVGDDTTDEDSFAAVQQLNGFGIKIGYGATHARYSLPDVAAFVAWLEGCLNEGCFSFGDLCQCN